MDLTIKRTHPGLNSVIGEMSINDCFECYTLEDPDGANDRIPTGTYRVVLDFSQRFQRIAPHILGNGVDARGIRIHAGNTQADTEGCILVGKEKGLDCILESKDALKALMVKLNNAWAREEPITLTIS